VNSCPGAFLGGSVFVYRRGGVRNMLGGSQRQGRGCPARALENDGHSATPYFGDGKRQASHWKSFEHLVGGASVGAREARRCEILRGRSAKRPCTGSSFPLFLRETSARPSTVSKGSAVAVNPLPVSRGEVRFPLGASPAKPPSRGPAGSPESPPPPAPSSRPAFFGEPPDAR